MRINSSMEALIQECPLKGGQLHESLSALLNRGIEFDGGRLLLSSQIDAGTSSLRTQFQDDTGFECFVNHIHLDDIIESASSCSLLTQAFLFADRLTELLPTSRDSEKVEYIVSADEDTVNVRFHLVRPNENWLADDLEKYAEAVAVMILPSSPGAKQIS